MKAVEMYLVETKVNGKEKSVFTYVDLDADYSAGWGLPMDANKKIVSAERVAVNVFEVGDSVTCDVRRNMSENEDGISSGGKWETKTAVVRKAYLTGGSIRLDDGDIRSISLIMGEDGYPSRNIQPAAKREG
jgi:hypothetical protein